MTWRGEAHGLGEGRQHRLLCQPEAQPSTQGSGETAGNGEWACPYLSDPALYPLLLPPPVSPTSTFSSKPEQPPEPEVT